MQTVRGIKLIRKYSVLSTVCSASTSLHKIPFNCSIVKKQLHLSRLLQAKVFTEVENAHNYSMLDPSIFRNCQLEHQSTDNNIENEIVFNQYLNQVWREKNITEIIDGFKNVKSFCIRNDINVSDVRFDKLVDGLMDNCEKINENQLIDLLHCLIDYPMCSGLNAHNFHDIWSCLDDISCTKLYNNNSNIEQLFALADLWYKWNMAKVSDFIFILLDRLIRKADALSKDQIVRVYFYFAVCRKRNVDFEYEYALQNKINEMNIDEMAVIASGYFKSKTRIKTSMICETMIKSVIDNSRDVHEMALCSIIKALRYSQHLELMPRIAAMLDKLNPEFHRISNICCIHLILLPTTYFLYHENTIRKTIEKLHPTLSTLRLKDLERILFVLTTFNFRSSNEPKSIFQSIYDELHKTERREEIDKYIHVLPAALNYLSLKGIYSYELSDYVLNKDFWQQFGKTTKYLPRELLSLDYCLEIDCSEKNYTGNRLPTLLRNKAIKWHTEYTPFEHKWKKIRANDQLFLDVVGAVKHIIKTDDCLYIHHILPHFSKADIVLCKNVQTNKFVRPEGFEKYQLGDIMRPPLLINPLKWYAIMIIGWNNTTRNTMEPLGHVRMKERQLKTIGYHPIWVYWHEFTKLNEEERINYIESKLI